MTTLCRSLFVAVSICAAAGISAAQGPAAGADPMKRLANDTPVAMIDGEIIRMRDLDAYSQSQDPRKVFQLNQQLYEFRQKMLDTMLGERLLSMEARTANVTVEQIVAQKAIVQRVTEAEILEMFNRANLQPNPGYPQVDLATARPMIARVLEDRKKAEARARYVEQLKAKARKAGKPIATNLQPPRQAITVAKTDPARGAGKVEVVEFSDFECPYCRQVEPVLRSILTQFDGRIKLVWKDFPLPDHQFAQSAAEAARCAGDQGKFWQYHDVLFANQQALASEDLKKHADTLGLEPRAFSQCLDGGKYRALITGALQAAAPYVVLATPTVFINGRMVMGVAPQETYARIISEELETAQ